MANTTIRETAKRKRIALWEVAEALGIHESVLSRKLRHDLDSKETEHVLAVIEKLSKEDK